MRRPIHAVLPAVAILYALAALPVAAHAADAAKPYSRVDKRNDAGNNTGDSAVDQLNAAQLDENQPRGSKSDGFDRNRTPDGSGRPSSN